MSLAFDWGYTIQENKCSLPTSNVASPSTASKQEQEHYFVSLSWQERSEMWIAFHFSRTSSKFDMILCRRLESVWQITEPPLFSTLHLHIQALSRFSCMCTFEHSFKVEGNCSHHQVSTIHSWSKNRLFLQIVPSFGAFHLFLFHFKDYCKDFNEDFRKGFRKYFRKYIRKDFNSWS